MTVNTTDSTVIYSGNGVSTEFDFPFKVLDESHLEITRRDTATGLIDYTYTDSDYTITGIGEALGGTVELNDPLESGYKIIITRVVPYTQEVDIVNQSGFYPEVIEDQLDLMEMQTQQVADAAGRSIKVPPGETIDEMPGAAARANKFPAFDALGVLYMSEGTGSDGFRADAGARTGAALIGTGAPAILTTVEAVLDKNATWWGIAKSGSNAGERAQDVFDELSDLAGDKGAVIRLDANAEYDWELDPADDDYNEGIKMRPRIDLDLQGSRVTRRCHADNERGFILMSHAKMRNGRVDALSEFVSVEGSSLATQPGPHGPIGIGAIYGSGGTVADPSEFEGAHSWLVDGLTLTADKDVDSGGGLMRGTPLIQGFGGVHNGTISNCYAPDSALASGFIAFDWGFLSEPGDFESGTEANYTQYREDWDNDLLRTTHPHGIRIIGNKCGNLTRPNLGQDVGTYYVRLSGCRGFDVRNGRSGTTTDAMVYILAGDPAFEFADVVSRTLGMDGTVVFNIEATAPQHGYLARLDSFGDNLNTAIQDHAYDAYSRPLVYARLTIDGLRGYTDLEGDALEGIRCTKLWGAEIKNWAASGFKKNAWLDEGCVDVDLHNGSATFARESNIYVGHGDSPPRDCKVRSNLIHSAGRGGGSHDGIKVENHVGTEISANVCGIPDVNDPSTIKNINVTGGTGLNCSAPNRHYSTSAAGQAESILSGAEGDAVDSWIVGEMIDPTLIATQYGGVSVLAEWRRTYPDGTKRAQFIADRAALSGDVLPAGGTFQDGDVIKYWELSAGGWRGSACTTKGTAGTLAGVTGSITTGTDDLVVNTTTGLEVGHYIAIAGVTGIKKITAINGLAVTIDSNADATVAAAAVTYSAPVFKRYSAIEA